MPPDTPNLAEAVLRGTLDREAIEARVDAAWNDGRFVETHALVAIPEADPEVLPYALCETVSARRVYGASGEPGCLRVHTPPSGPWDGDPDTLPVPLHAHHSAHITVVTRGCPVFIHRVGCRLERTPLEPGSVVLYPAGLVHTFHSVDAFEVVSLQADYVDPRTSAFAHVAGQA